ncbi:MAG: methyltransferase type 11 [Flavisolibacter sp.]|jgi:ubiquinone/menaquinone biosynthesis C-methylase UbiE|nr:methyltransferase type 11 [Flavisolibacter sp.]
MQDRFTCTVLTSFILLFLVACNACNSRKNQVSISSSYTQKTPHPDGTGKVYKGREIAQVMSAAGGDWLERTTRQQEEDADAAIAALPLQSNSVVADIGAGSGYYTFRIAPKAPQGKVYAVEVQDEFIASLEARKKQSGATNITIVKGSATSPNLPEASVDLAMMVDVYHELEYPKEMLQAISKALKPDGKLLLLEYRAEDPSVPIKELHKMSVAQANKELTAAGFTLDKLETFLPIQHFLLYRKAAK